MDGPLRPIPGLLMDIVPPPPMMPRTRDPTKEANRNQKNAVLAWSSRHRFDVSCEPLVKLLVVVYDCNTVRH
jgi:hypothetical protein